jgi:predicted RND superfamily exporter protein
MKYLIFLFFIILSSCSLEKRLSIKQKKANKLDFEISELKKSLNLPLDTFLFSSDTIFLEKRTTKYDTIKLKCDSNNRVVYIDNEPLQGSEIIKETEYIEVEKIIQKDVLKTKKEIIYKEKEFEKKHMILMAFGFVTIILLLLYSFGKFAGLLIKLFNLKNL